MSDWLHRERMLIGDTAVESLKNKKVLIFGIGGVGSYTLEALARAGVGFLFTVDNDIVSETNINRQLIADTTTVGKLKVEIAAERCRLINPDIFYKGFALFAEPRNIPEIIEKTAPDYIVDAIDTVTSKLSIIETANRLNIPIISCMGTGSKLDPERLQIADINKTHTCPLAKVMRIKLRERGIKKCKVLFSDELPIKAGIASELQGETKRNIPGSISFVPSCAGLIIAGQVIRDLISQL